MARTRVVVLVEGRKVYGDALFHTDEGEERWERYQDLSQLSQLSFLQEDAC